MRRRQEEPERYWPVSFQFRPVARLLQDARVRKATGLTQRAPLVPHSAEHRAEAAPRGGAAHNGALTRQPLRIGTRPRPARPGARGYASSIWTTGSYP